MSVADTLRRAGIEPRHTRLGEQRLACPQCATVKHRPRDDALSLLIEAKGATWICHRCGFKGGVRDGKAPTFQPGNPTQVSLLPPPQDSARALSIWRAAEPARAHHRYLVAKHLPPDGLRRVERFWYSRENQALGATVSLPLRRSFQLVPAEPQPRNKSGQRPLRRVAAKGAADASSVEFDPDALQRYLARDLDSHQDASAADQFRLGRQRTDAEVRLPIRVVPITSERKSCGSQSERGGGNAA